MDKHLIMDRSCKHSHAVNRYTPTKLEGLNAKWRLFCLGSTAIAWLLILVTSIWVNAADTVTLSLLLGTLGCFITLWLYGLKAYFGANNSRSLDPSILSDSKIFCWLAVSLCLFCLLSNPAFQLLICVQLFASLGLAILANKLIQRSNNFKRYPKPKPPWAESCYRTKQIKAKGSNSKKSKTEQNISVANEQLNDLKRFTSYMPMGIVQWDKKRRIASINPAAAKIFQCSIEENSAIGVCIDQLITKQQIALVPHTGFDQFLFQIMPNDLAQKTIMGEAKIICKWAELHQHDHKDNRCGGMACFEDVTEQVKMILKVKHHAYFDLLTGLPNRYRLAEEMKRVLLSIQRANAYCALLFIDLDHFKAVNDRWGHSHGDAVLRAFSQRIRKVIRSQETVARLGGDEFVAIVEGLGTCKDKAKSYVAQISAKIVAIAKKDFVIDNKVSRIGCSIGITLFNDATLSSKDLLERADHALFRIKRNGRCNYMFDETKAIPGNPVPLRELQFQH
jgi:diguanylate cyclase (GGDEF)-like protein